MSNSRAKILVVNDHNPTYFKPFEFLGLKCCRDHSILDRNPSETALIVFTGGSDITPGVYGSDAHPNTYHNIERDILESRIFNIAALQGIPMVGICRGAQLLCVMAGGRLVQDITGHHGKHEILACYPDGKVHNLLVSSDHHQMQYPFDTLPKEHYNILAWSEKPLSKHYAFDGETIITVEDALPELKIEPDVVWYPRIKALAVQYHPEWMQNGSPGVKYFQGLVEQYLVPLMEKNDIKQSRKKAAQTAG